MCSTAFFSVALHFSGLGPMRDRRGRMEQPNPEGFGFVALFVHELQLSQIG